MAFGGDDHRQLAVGGGRNVEIGLERGGGRFAAGFVAQRDRLRLSVGVEGARLVVERDVERLGGDRLAGGGQCYRLHLFGLDRGVVGLERERQNGRQTFQTEGHGFALRGLARLGAVMGYECRHEGIVGAVEIAALLRTLRTERDVERRSVDGRVDGLVGPVLLLLSQLAFEHFGVGVVGEFRSFLAGGAAFGVDRQLVGRLPRTGETAVGLVDLDLRAALGQRGFEADLDFAGCYRHLVGCVVGRAGRDERCSGCNEQSFGKCVFHMDVCFIILRSDRRRHQAFDRPTR